MARCRREVATLPGHEVRVLLCQLAEPALLEDDEDDEDDAGAAAAGAAVDVDVEDEVDDGLTELVEEERLSVR